MAITNSHPPMEDPVTLIRERIKEKRIFEARFLFRQFGDEIATDRKMKLADELAATLSRAEQMLQRARSHAAGGERSQAEQVYREIEAIVVDMPGVAEEIKALAGASALITKIKATAPIVADPEPPTEVAAAEVASEPEPAPADVGPRQRRRTRWPLWLAAGCTVVAVSLLALWYDDVTNTSPPLTAPPEQPSTQTILIRPMVAEGSAPVEETDPPPAAGPALETQIEQKPAPETVTQIHLTPTVIHPATKSVRAQVAKTKTDPSHRTLRLGTLQVQQTKKK